MTVVAIVTLVLSLVAIGAGGARWLRVSQREHYLPGSVIRFAGRWWGLDWRERGLFVVAVAAAFAAFFVVGIGLLAAGIVIVGPIGLGVRGRTSRLGMTRRLRSLAALAGTISIIPIVVFGVIAGWRGAALAGVIVALLAPLSVDGAAGILWPVEGRLASRYVESAAARLRSVRPQVVAITGSYGKTTTKGYVAQLASGRFEVVASPRSFNNQAGLARTVNELLVPGTDILVAEMGTYGPGEIRALCSWMPPTISVITAIGPVHLERFGSLDAIVQAKSEIAERATVTVLNVDEERLLALADRLEAEGGRVVRCSGRDPGADVAFLIEEDSGHLFLAGTDLGRVELPEVSASIAPSNVACAIGVAVELGVSPEEIVSRLAGLPVAENRLQVRMATSGATILDDTFNSNPAGTRLALGMLASLSAARRVVVTPGMVELGRLQREENERFAEAIAAVADDLVVVGRTNRKALVAGVRRSKSTRRTKLHVVSDRESAVDFVRGELGPGDAVLYENDLPDHYP